MKNKNINNLFLSILYAFISAFILYLLISGSIKNFIHPRLIKFFIVGSVVTILLSIIQFICFMKSSHKEKFKYAILLFIVPFILGACVNVSDISSNISENKSLTIVSDNSSDTKDTDDFLSMDVIDTNQCSYYKAMEDIGDNITAYKGKKIIAEGFVYRNKSLSSDEFVAARMMIVCCTADAQVVGFLCRDANAGALKENEWVRITGTLDDSAASTLNCPIIINAKIEKVQKPQESYIYPQF